MKIKNLTAKPIGFGTVVVLPDQTGETPKGYGKDHPTVKYYLSRGWIVEVGAKSGGAATVTTDGLNVGFTAGTGSGEGGGSDNGEGGGENGGSDDSTGGAAGSPASKPIDRMNKEELHALAFERGLEFAETDTKQQLIDKIKAAKKAEE